MQCYAFGQSVKITNTFVDENDDLINPTTITTKIGYLNNDNVFVLLETLSKSDMSNPSTGVWVLDYLPENEGIHTVSIISDGNIQSGYEVKFKVNDSPFVT